MNPYEMNKEKLFCAVRNWLDDEGAEDGYNIYADEAEERIELLAAHIESLPFLDEGFKAQFHNELATTVNCAAAEAFDTGLNIGLSLLTCLLNGEKPEIQVYRKLPKEIPRQYRAVFRGYTDFAEYMKEAGKYMTDEERKELESKAAYFMQKHFEKENGLF